jgi:hypothetical protein
MKTSQNLAFIFIFLLILLILPSFYREPDKEIDEQRLLEKANLFNLKFPQEKIYLHLDRPSYWANDDIWFKAYLKNSPIPESNLYVELLNSTGKVVYKNLCWAQNGLAYGDFHLEDTLSSGVYQIRAYTDWLRNFDEAWFFRKNLVIWNLRDKQPSVESNELKAKDVDIQFFPEGGTFISGLKNRVAFKVIDKNGKGIDLEGEIIDDRGNKITEIKSQFRGIGNFVIEPEENRKYSAHFVVPGRFTIQVNLPTTKKDGVVLSVDPTDTGKIQISVRDKSRTPDGNQEAEYLLVGQAGGTICYKTKILTTEGSSQLAIEKKSLPPGIVRFTLFDQGMIPHCERLVFISRHDNIDIEIKPEKTEYTKRERVHLDIKTISASQIPLSSNLSVSVFNPENQLETEKYPDNILTHFLLNSELRGTIEEPAYYFKDDSLSTLSALDNLMLTQGYRQFEWKEISENKLPEITYQPVACIQLGGTVTSTVLGKPVRNAKVTMMTVKSMLGTYEQKTDSLGQFLFTDLYFRDTVYVALQALNEKGNRNNEIEIDERSGTSPKTGYLPFSYKYEKENEVLTSTFLSELSPEIINRKWRLSDTILIGDINVLARKKKKDDGHIRPYLEADYSVDISKLDKVYNNLSEMMETSSAVWRSIIKRTCSTC